MYIYMFIYVCMVTDPLGHLYLNPLNLHTLRATEDQPLMLYTGTLNPKPFIP